MIIKRGYGFILGSKTHHTDKIEQFVNAAGILCKYATFNGERVTNENAYQADPVDINEFLSLNLNREHITIVFVECSPAFLSNSSSEYSSRTPYTTTLSYHIPGALGQNTFLPWFMKNSHIGHVLWMLAADMTTKEFIEILDRYTGRDNELQFDLSNGLEPGDIFFNKGRWHIRLKDGFIEIPEDMVLCAAADCVDADKKTFSGVDTAKLTAYLAETKGCMAPAAKVA